MRKHKQNRNKRRRRRRRRRRSNWQRHSPSAYAVYETVVLGSSPPEGREFLVRRSCCENYSALLVTIQLDLAHCNAVSYADRHSRTQQQSRTSPPPTKSVADVASLQRRPVRLSSGCGDATRTMRPGRVAGWPGRAGPVDRRATRSKLLPLTSF